MQLHRAITLVVMILLAIGLLVMMTASAISNFDNRSLIALGVVVVAAAAGGIAFSWKRYYRRVPRTDR
jgi:multidrug resistance efflux pump